MQSSAPRPLDESARILNLGCGTGFLLDCLADWYDAELVGGDVVGDHVKYASETVERSMVAQFDGASLPFRDDSFDVVFSLQVVEHVPDPDLLIAEVVRVLRPNGVFVLTTPNPECIAASALGERWQGFKHDHISLRTPSQWRSALKSASLTVESDGTTLVSGLPVLGKMPFALLSWVPQALFGYFPWESGESYKSVSTLEPSTN